MSRSKMRGLVLSFLLCAGMVQAASEAPPPAASFFGDVAFAPELPPAASFFGNAAFSDPKLSPSGRHLAARIIDAYERSVLVVADLNDPAAKPVVINYPHADVHGYVWVNDDYLAFELDDFQKAPGDRSKYPGLFGVKRDGTKDIMLAIRRMSATTTGGPTDMPGVDIMTILPLNQSKRKIQVPVTLLTQQPGTPNGNRIYVAEPRKQEGEPPDTRMMLVDPIHGGSIRIERPATVDWWELDAAGQPRLARSAAGRTNTLWYRLPDGKWRKLREDLPLGSAPDPVVPLGFGPDGTLYASAANGKETKGLYALDLKSGKIKGSALVAGKGYDIDAQLVTDSMKLLGVRYVADAPDTVWFDDKMAAVQKRVDALLPATINKLTPPRYGKEPWVLVESFSDVIPTGYLMFNQKTGTLTMLGNSHPRIDNRQMGTMRTIHYTARDGLEIEALLTLPPDAAGKPLPMVVLAHDGPWQRGSAWGWRDESQFLASRGYAVLEPAYRGSTGLGNKLFEAGRRQWGAAMQDDLADGARWAVEQGFAAEGRICIGGKGYGGYATLMGLARDPGLYQCGIAWGAITDLPTYLATGWDALDGATDDFKRGTLMPLVGDPVRDAAALKQVSPVAQAARITAPLLLAHGSADAVVPVEHGRKFYSAVKRSNPDVEWVEYTSELNTWEMEKTRIDFWQKVDAFLDKQIGNKRKGRVSIIYDRAAP